MLNYSKYKNSNHNPIEFNSNSITDRIEFNYISFYHFKQGVKIINFILVLLFKYMIQNLKLIKIIINNNFVVYNFFIKIYILINMIDNI